MADTPTHKALRQYTDEQVKAAIDAWFTEDGSQADSVNWEGRMRAALAAADAALSVQAEPVEQIERLKAAIEGECDGLAITDDHARAILQYVLGDATTQPPAPVPAVPPGWAFYTADFSMKAHETAPVGRAILMRTGDDFRAWFTLSDEDRDRIPLYIQGAGPTIHEAIAEACKAALSAHNITGGSNG